MQLSARVADSVAAGSSQLGLGLREAVGFILAQEALE
jgi:hypothetical protein